MLRNFRYPLEPVLTKSQWDLDGLSSELAAARHHLSQSEEAVNHTRKSLTALWREFDEARKATALDVSKESALRQYADRLTAQLQHRLAIQAEARTLHERITEQVQRALREVRGLEKHRDGQQAAHTAESRILQSKEADDAWLMTHSATAQTP